MGWLDKLEADAEVKSGLRINYIDESTGFWSPYGQGIPSGLSPYARDVGDGLWSNVVMGPVRWIMRNFTEANAVVQVKRNDLWEYTEDHPLELKLANPNPYYGDDLLWQATVLSYCLDGNGYWQKVRNVFGDVLGYWYLPHYRMEAKWPQDGSTFISHYEYTPLDGGKPIVLPVSDVVHFRFGLDPENPRYGLSGVKTLLREIYTDEEASNFSAAILKNMGVPGGVISPASDKMTPRKDEVDYMKQYMKDKFTGKNRGEWFVTGIPTSIQQFGFDPQALMLGNVRDITEERVCAILGIPAAVVGFGSGLQQTKVGATMRELRKEAWDSCLRPMQNSMAKQGSKQLLPDFVSQLRRFRLRFDTSDFAASQEEESEKAERLGKLAERGLLSVDVVQEHLGFTVDPKRKGIYLGPPPATNDLPPEPSADEPDNQLLSAIKGRLNGHVPTGSEN